MTNKKVYIFAGPHPIYKSLIDFPPKGFSYKSNISFKEFDNITIYKKGYERKKKFALWLYNSLRLPRIIYLLQAKDCDLIFACRGFLVLNNKPWIIEIEHADSFGAQENRKKIVEKFLSGKNCKTIISRGRAVTSSLLSKFNGANFKHKIVEIPPAIPTAPKFKRKKSKKIRLLFISGFPSFYRKGGKQLLDAFLELEKKYEIELIMRADVPDEIKKKYKSKNIKFITKKIQYSKIYQELYSKADIFVLPTYFDGYGMVYLEAMAAGIPCIGTDIFAVPEIIEDGKNGFMIKSPISNFNKDGTHKIPALSEKNVKDMDLSIVTKQLVEKISILIENPKLRKKMGEHGKKIIESGKFSIVERNRRLKEVYEGALN